MNLSPGSICFKNKEKETLIFGQNDPSLHNAPGIDFLEFLTIFPFLMGLQRRVSDSFRLADGGGGRVGGQTHPGGDSDTNTSPPKMASIRQRTTVRELARHSLSRDYTSYSGATVCSLHLTRNMSIIITGDNKGI